MLSNVATALFIGYASTADISLQTITFTLGVGFIFTALYYLWFKKHYTL
jgi:putative Ca2+/H+ antiporter (TMEM165/GDT1 family)